MRRIVVLCMLLALSVAGCKQEIKKTESIRPVRVYTVEDSSDNESRTFPGKIKATQEATMAFRISGQIVKLDVKEGDYVKKGQLIAQLDQRDYQAAVADLDARLAGARSVLNEAHLNIERNRKLLNDRIIAQSAYDTAESNYESSRAKVLSLEQSLRRAALNLQYTRLTAPFSGFIAEIIPSNHEYVQAKEPIVSLADTSALDIVINIPESVWIKAGNDIQSTIGCARASFESLPGKSFPVRIKEYQTNANPGTQTYEVTLTMDNPEGLAIQPGMTAELVSDITDAGNDKTVSIPFSSVVGEVEGNKYVWVLKDDNTVDRREVKIEKLVKNMFHVSGGINPGDELVVAGVNYLHQGQKVKVLEGRIGGRE